MFNFFKKNESEKPPLEEKSHVSKELFYKSLDEIVSKDAMNYFRKNFFNKIYDDLVSAGADLDKLIPDINNFSKNYADERYLPFWQAVLDTKKNYYLCEYICNLTKTLLSLNLNTEKLMDNERLSVKEKFGTLDEYNAGKEDNMIELKPYYDFAKEIYIFKGLTEEQFEKDFIRNVADGIITRENPFKFDNLENIGEKLDAYNNKFFTEENIARAYAEWKKSADKELRYEFIMKALGRSLDKMGGQISLYGFDYNGDITADKSLCIMLPNGENVPFGNLEELKEITLKKAIERIYGTEDRLDQLLTTYSQIREMEGKKPLDIEKSKEIIFESHISSGVPSGTLTHDEGFFDMDAYQDVDLALMRLGDKIGEEIHEDFMEKADEMISNRVEIEFKYRNFKNLSAINCDNGIKDLMDKARENKSQPKIDSAKMS